jgi:molybdopterin-guanine dinucleotide biosynthesis protein A
MKPPCIILAGGRSSRMGGGNKCLASLDGQPLLTHILRTVVPQTADILINANGSPEIFARFGLPVRADILPNFQGPLAGLLTGLLWARQSHPGATHLLSVSCDTPFLPTDLAARLDTQRHCQQAEIAIARDSERVHPTIGLWPVALAEKLETDLRDTNCRAIYRWLGNLHVAETPFPAAHFRNINTPEDLAAATQFYLRYSMDPAML